MQEIQAGLTFAKVLQVSDISIPKNGSKIFEQESINFESNELVLSVCFQIYFLIEPSLSALDICKVWLITY